MKNKWRSKPLIECLAAGILLLTASCNTEKAEQGSAHEHPATYTCPMHPQIVKEGPGSCPICGMDLVPLQSGGDSAAVSEDLHYLLQPTSSTIVAGIRTVTPVQKEMEVEADANGLIVYDTRRSNTIPVRFGGRIEKLYVNYNFEPVRKGQKILEIYSPEIVAAQKELLYLLGSDPGNTGLIGAARQKLRLLGVTDAQISRLIETGEESYSLAVYSPYSGYIYEEAGAAATLPAAGPQWPTAGGMDNMNSGGMSAASPVPAAPAQTELSVREGMYLERGQTAFRVINTDRVWAEFTIYPQAAPYIKKGDLLTIVPDFNRELRIKAAVDFVQPFYQEGENFSKVRVYLDNTAGRFMPGQLVTARFQSRTDSAWWLPSAAVLDLGTTKVVFRREKEAFHPVPVKTGRTSGKWTEIISDLSSDDTVADNGHYLVDSEGFVKMRNTE